MNYYRRFPGDYARDTNHLSTLEHGIYTLLLDHLYSTEKPIADSKAAMRIARIETRNSASRRAVHQVLNQFFIESSTGYWHKRVEEEINHANKRRLAAQENGKKGGRPTQQEPGGVAIANPEESSPDSRLQTPVRRPNFEIPQARVGVALTESERYSRAQFEAFRKAYPEGAWIDGDVAFREWIRLSVLDQTAAVESLPAWKGSDRWQETRFIPAPIKFIQNRRWEHPPKIKTKEKSLNEQLVEIMERQRIS